MTTAIVILLLIGIQFALVLCFGALCNIENAVDELAKEFREEEQ